MGREASLKPTHGIPGGVFARGIAARTVSSYRFVRYRTAASWSERGSFARPECDGIGLFAHRARRENRIRGSNMRSDDPRGAGKRGRSRRTTGILDDARRSTAPLPETSRASYVWRP